MSSIPTPTPEEMEQLVEKAKRELQAKLDSMTPEERAQAQRRAQEAIEADQARMQQLLDSAARIAGGDAPKQTSKVCGHCGAQDQSGKFCEYCGMPL